MSFCRKTSKGGSLLLGTNVLLKQCFKISKGTIRRFTSTELRERESSAERGRSDRNGPKFQGSAISDKAKFFISSSSCPDELIPCNEVSTEFELIKSDILSNQPTTNECCCADEPGCGHALTRKYDLQSMETVFQAKKREVTVSKIDGLFTSSYSHKTFALKHGLRDLTHEAEMLKMCGPLCPEFIVQFMGSYVHRQYHFMVMEYMEGGCLLTFLDHRRDQQVTWTDTCVGVDKMEASALLKQLTTAIYHLHEKGIVHHDISLGNVFVCDALGGKLTRIKLGDFEMSGYVGYMLRSNLIKGTENFIDPVYKKTGKYRNSSDIYSAGVVLVSACLFKDLYHVKTIEIEYIWSRNAWNEQFSETKEMVKSMTDMDPARRMTAEQILQKLNGNKLDNQ